MDAADALAVTAIVEQIKPLLTGKPIAMQGAALADLLAICLAQQHVPGDVDATREARAELLAMHCSMVRGLVEVNARALGTTPSVAD